MEEVVYPVRTMKMLGIENLFLTNAAGCVNETWKPGDLMLITDHINLSGQNPLIGKNNEKYGPRFPDMSLAYNLDCREKFKAVARKCGVELHEGVYLMVTGPNFETAAEIRAFKVLGADAIGMSTVPEVISAVYAGMKVLGVSVITNLGTGLHNTQQSHNETLAQAALAAGKLQKLLELYLEEE